MNLDQHLLIKWKNNLNICRFLSRVAGIIIMLSMFVYPITIVDFLLDNFTPAPWVFLIIVSVYCLYLVFISFLTINTLRYGELTLAESGIKKLEDLAADGKLISTLNELIEKIGIRKDVELHYHTSDFSQSPHVVQIKDSYHIIIPMGFLKIFSKNERHAKSIVAHELSHIIQNDLDVLFSVKVFTRILFKYILPIQIVIFISNCFLFISIYNSRLLEYYQINYVEYFVMTFLSIPIYLLLRYIMRFSEKVADFTAAIVTGSESTIGALRQSLTIAKSKKSIGLLENRIRRLSKIFKDQGQPVAEVNINDFSKLNHFFPELKNGYFFILLYLLLYLPDYLSNSTSLLSSVILFFSLISSLAIVCNSSYFSRRLLFITSIIIFYTSVLLPVYWFFKNQMFFYDFIADFDLGVIIQGFVVLIFFNVYSHLTHKQLVF